MATNARLGWAQANGEPVALAGYVQNTWDMSEPENPRRLDQILQGQSIATYTHQKSGTTHTLTGLVGGQCIRWVMSATAEYGDSWTLNGEPVVVVYCDGNPVLPHSLIAGDMLIGAVDTGKVALAIPTPKPNKNLLDNWYFADPINQRGQTSYTTVNAMTIDRWRLYFNTSQTQGAAAALSDGALHLSFQSGTYTRLTQVLDSPVGGTFTLSFLVRSASADTFMRAYMQDHNETQTSIGYQEFSGAGQLISFTAQPDTKISTIFFQVMAAVGSPAIENAYVYLAAIKLEEGPRQTLARQDADGDWVLLDPPPNKATELLKCQRYFRPLIFAMRADDYNVSQSFTQVTVPLIPPMRALPTAENVAQRLYAGLAGGGGWSSNGSGELQVRGDANAMTAVFRYHPVTVDPNAQHMLYTASQPGIYAPIYLSAEL